MLVGIKLRRRHDLLRSAPNPLTLAIRKRMKTALISPVTGVAGLPEEWPLLEELQKDWVEYSQETSWNQTFGRMGGFGPFQLEGSHHPCH